MVATAGSIAKLPSKNVANMQKDPQISSNVLIALLRNHSENTHNIDSKRSITNITYHATDLGVAPAFLFSGRSNNHGKQRPAATTSHKTEVITPRFPFVVILEICTAWVELMVLSDADGRAIFCLHGTATREVRYKSTLEVRNAARPYVLLKVPESVSLQGIAEDTLRLCFASTVLCCTV